jgi:hypothetical protein
MTEPTTPAQAVAKGAALLDREVPGWAEQIDLPTLNMSSCSRCILGQLYGEDEDEGEGYWTGMDQFRLSAFGSRRHGFSSEFGRLDRELAEAWAAEVLRRVPA